MLLHVESFPPSGGATSTSDREMRQPGIYAGSMTHVSRDDSSRAEWLCKKSACRGSRCPGIYAGSGHDAESDVGDCQAYENII